MHATVDRLRLAVWRRSWELHYQPIVELASGATAGVEALVRWRQDDGNLIPPAEFIPLAEESGLIGAIGDWVVEELLRQYGEWATVLDSRPTFVSFNLSPYQLTQPGLANRLLARMDARGIEPSTIMIEITESLAMVDPDRTRVVLAALRERGVRIALDDFGAGHSSLGRLRDLSVDVLKLDRSFVRDLPNDRRASRLAGAIIAFALDVGMEPLAEGIEHEDQRQFLLDRGCVLGQGYHLGQPGPPDQLRSMHVPAAVP